MVPAVVFSVVVLLLSLFDLFLTRSSLGNLSEILQKSHRNSHSLSLSHWATVGSWRGGRGRPQPAFYTAAQYTNTAGEEPSRLSHRWGESLSPTLRDGLAIPPTHSPISQTLSNLFQRPHLPQRPFFLPHTHFVHLWSIFLYKHTYFFQLLLSQFPYITNKNFKIC